MKNIKQIKLYYAITLSIFSIPCAGMWGKSQALGVDGAKVLAGAGVEATKIASAAAIEAAQQFGIDATKVAANAGIEATKIASAATIEVAQKIGTEATKIAADAGIEATKIAAEAGKEVSKTAVQGLTPYIGAFVGVFAIKEAATLGMDIYKYNNPDQEKIERNRAAKKKIAIYDAEDAFRNCLMKNAYTQKNKSGLPVACDECGITFAMTAGKAAYQDMSETYKSTYQDL